MNLAQSPHIPAAGQKPRFSDWRWLPLYAARGLLELIRARVAFARLEAKEIPERNRAAKAANRVQSSAPDATIARIAYVLPRLSDRLPWRSDCLIQAIAGQNWLRSLGEAGEIQIGVENPKDGEFGAHAWLMLGETIVTGGDIERYQVILSDSRFATDSPTSHPSGERDTTC